MPAPAPFSAAHGFPALYLYPIDDSFIPKHISLPNNQRVKIGRQTNARTVPGERNGYFDSKVLSRQHAEVWEEGNKIFIRDVKSSNGTFINGERLSPEGLESDPYELKTEDVVEFGIDIVGEDNKTIVHHKVAARVVCVFSEHDAQAAARAEQSHSTSGMNPLNHAGPSNGGSFNFAPAPGGPGSSSQRRPSLQQQGFAGMGGMGGSMRPPGKSGLTFDHILSRLQGELQKSRDTGAELHNLTGSMSEIHDTLGGSLPQSIPSYPSSLPPIRPPQPHAQEPSLDQQQQQSLSTSPSALDDIQTQLHDTQSSLATHMDKMRVLEDILAEHEVIKREVSNLRDMMEERKRDMETAHNEPSQLDRYDDDDARSVDTVTPHELERVDEEDEEQLAAEEEEEERRRRREELGRPRTPEPTGMGMRDDDYESHLAEKRLVNNQRRSLSPSAPQPPHDDNMRDSFASSPFANELAMRIATLSDQLESALSLSTALQAQHTAAQTTISALESKVTALESVVQATQSQVQVQEDAVSSIRLSQASAASSTDREPERESLTTMLNDWKKGVEGQWSSVQEEWTQERERLNKAREEWESKFKTLEIGLGNTASKLDTGLALMNNGLHSSHTKFLPNGHENSGLVTPPSPRSLSSDSNRRHRRRRSASSRGRSRSRSVDADNNKDVETTASESADSTDATFSTTTSITSASSAGPTFKSEPSDEAITERDSDLTVTASQPHKSLRGLFSHSTENTSIVKGDAPRRIPSDVNTINASAVVGVLVLGMAAAAVVWRVTPDNT